MQRIDASQLINLLLTKEKFPQIRIILSENGIYRKIIEDDILFCSQKTPQFFDGKNAIAEYVEYAATESLFFAQQKSIVTIPEKMTAKQWQEEKKYLSLLPSLQKTSAYFFGPTAYRAFIKQTDFKNLGFVYLCYEPNDLDLQKCIELLAMRQLSCANQKKQEFTKIISLAKEYYAGDLLSIQAHLSRMEKTGLSFSQTFAENPHINLFQVLDALVVGDFFLITLRLQQCQTCGEDPFSIFSLLVYFLKQVLHVQSIQEQRSQNFTQAFQTAGIPFPAQARIQKAVACLHKHKLIEFFVTAPQIEYELRIQKNPHTYLAWQLTQWRCRINPLSFPHE